MNRFREDAPSLEPWRIVAAFLILFLLYQSAEGVGGRLLGSFAVQAGLMVAMLVAAWPVGRWLLRGRGYAAYGLGWSTRVPLWLAGGMVLAGAAKVAAIGIGLRIGAYAPADPAPLAVSTAAFLMLATFVPSIAEDILTRGLWWRALPWLRGTAFVLFTATVYLLNHIYRLSAGPAEWVMLLAFGIAYATAFVRTGSLWAAVGIHWGWNLANALSDGIYAVDADPAVAPWLSAAVNLAMAGMLLLLPASRPSGAAPRPARSRPTPQD